MFRLDSDEGIARLALPQRSLCQRSCVKGERGLDIEFHFRHILRATSDNSYLLKLAVEAIRRRTNSGLSSLTVRFVRLE